MTQSCVTKCVTNAGMRSITFQTTKSVTLAGAFPLGTPASKSNPERS